jgi:hypothetical protein
MFVHAFVILISFLSIDNDEDFEAHRLLRHLELIDDEAAEYGIKFAKCSDLLMAKKFGFRDPPGITYFRKGKPIKYDGTLPTNLIHSLFALTFIYDLR